MKIFGTLREIVAAVFRKDSQEITLKPNDGTYTGAVEVKLPPKLSAGAAVLVAEDVQQTLTNKVFSAGTIRDNTRLVNLEVRNELSASGNPTLKFYQDALAGTNKISMFAPAGLGADYNFSLPNGPGTANYVMRTDGTGITSWAQIVDASVSNSAAISDTKLATITTPGKVANGATTATNLNTPSAIVARDASGNFSAGTITASLSGNATSATTATTATSATNVTGTVAIANGGTGQTSQQAAMNALAGTQVANRVLRSDGTNTSLSQVALATDVSGTLPIGNGGTGQTTANAALNALLPSQGSSANKYLKTDGTNTSWASASGGAGEINAVLNSSGADGTTGWTGTSVVTGSNSPLNPIVTTAFSISNAATTESSTSGGYYPFTLPTGLQNRKLKVEFSYTTPATDVYKVSVYKGSTRVALTTDTGSPASTSLPASVTGGKFTAYFDTDNSSSWTVSITRTSGSTGPIYVTNVIVGPGIQPQGAVVGEWETSATPAGGWFISGPTNVSTAVTQMRIGRDAHLRYAIQATGTSASFTEVRIKLPSGMSIDTVGLNRSSSGRAPLGRFEITKPGVGNYTGIVFYETDNSIYCRYLTSTPIEPSSVTNSTPLAWNTTTGNTAINIDITVPIAEWAGSGTVQLAQNDVEYAYNTTAWGTDNTSSNFGYGPGGASITGALTGSLTQRITFQTPIQAGDDLAVEISSDGKIWRRSDVFMDASGNPVINSYSSAATGTSSAGVYLKSISNNTTQIDVLFMRYAAMANDDTPVVDWQNGWKWRVRKSSAGAAVGFGLYQPGVSAGLVSSSGLAGRADNATIATGFVGEKLDFTSRSVTPGNQTWVANTSALVTLTPGTWLIFGDAAFSIIGTAQAARIATSSSAGAGRISQLVTVQNSTLNVEGQMPVAYYQVASGTTQPLYMQGLASSSTTGTISVTGFAVRIA